MYYSIFDDTSDWLLREPILKPNRQGKGHPRANYQQKACAFNKRLAKRRAKNKASRKARKEQRK